ncbi:recombinase family protein [Paraburkholderia sp. 22099]|jgi:DNA invertase Pin-like site-specific DNA recombinase|uniref:recombinase family protein n=1 Tax=Paraburkholderia TaxID=1822464 RepID=UPI0011ABF26F|nr:recombinase family protein [Paraburkholderia terricola]MDR6490134.1 DNA invertase Pin-like site-specific DNA recombinase [Paraburkholderia terricola]
MPFEKIKVGYARVSTDEQHLDMQLKALESYGCSHIFSDKGLSGARFDRPGLKQALEAVQQGGTLVVWRLDRLGRSLRHLASIIGDLDKRKVRVVSLTEYIDTRSSSGRFTFHMLAAIAEFERGLIGERTRAGMAAARERGSSIGRPGALSTHQCEQARSMLKHHSQAFVAKSFSVHPRTLRRYLNKAERAPSINADAAIAAALSASDSTLVSRA